MTSTTTYAKPNMGDLDSDGIPWTGGEPSDKRWLTTKRTSPQTRFALRETGFSAIYSENQRY
jgi:hypothetical protein